MAALFTKGTGDPATGLTLAEIDLYLYRRATADGTVSTVWNGVHPTEEIGGGLYSRAYGDEDLATYDYFAYAHYTGATSLDADYSLQSDLVTRPGDVWGHSSRTLTQAAAAVTAAVAGATITIQRGDTLSAALTGLGSLSGYVSLDFTVKISEDDDDDAALIRIRKNASGSGDGLLRLNGVAAGTAGNGSITIDDAADGDITIALAAVETDDLVVWDALYYDVQMITASAVSTLTTGTVNVVADVTRAVS